MRDCLFRKGLVVGIIVLFIGVGVYPAVADESESSLNIKQNKPEIFLHIESSNKCASGIAKKFGCSGEVQNWGDEVITLKVYFNVTSYNFRGEYLGESSKFLDDTPFPPDIGYYVSIIPNYYGEIFTWVKATIEINNGEHIESEIGLSIGKWIYFFYFLT